jgi:hypothetical protein
VFDATFVPQRWNRYSYAFNNPTSLIDASGLNARAPCDPNTCTTVVGHTPTIDVGLQTWLYLEWLGLRGGGFVTDTSSSGGAGVGGTAVTAPMVTTTETPAPMSPPSPLPPGDPCSPAPTRTTIVSANRTTSAPTTTLGAIIGEVGGPIGSLAGGVLGSLFGVGFTASYVPSTKSAYVGVTGVFAPSWGGGNGMGVAVAYVPPGQNPNAIANGKSASVTFQPNLLVG